METERASMDCGGRKRGKGGGGRGGMERGRGPVRGDDVAGGGKGGRCGGDGRNRDPHRIHQEDYAWMRGRIGRGGIGWSEKGRETRGKTTCLFGLHDALLGEWLGELVRHIGPGILIGKWLVHREILGTGVAKTRGGKNRSMIRSTPFIRF